MKWKKTWGIVISIVVVLAAIAIYFVVSDIFSGQGNGEFQIDSILLIVIKSSGEYNGKLKVENLKDYGRHFDVSFISLEDFSSVSPESFYLGAQESKDIEIKFSNPGGKEAGVYSGSLNILSEESSRQLPIILEIESEDILFEGNIEVYPAREIFPGKEITAEIKIFDLSQIGTSSIGLEYFIKDFSGETIDFKKEDVIIKNEVLLTKAITLPANIKEGDYVFGAVFKYKNSIATASTNFRVGRESKGTLEDTNFLYFVVFLVFIIVIFLGFILYSIYSRDKLLEDLRLQYRDELRRQSGYIKKREEETKKVCRTREERKISKRILKKVKERRLREIKRIQEIREKQLKKLKKTKKKDKIKAQIEKWEKQGYDTSVLDKKAKIPSVSQIAKKINEWKKKGYNTKVLEEQM